MSRCIARFGWLSHHWRNRPQLGAGYLGDRALQSTFAVSNHVKTTRVGGKDNSKFGSHQIFRGKNVVGGQKKIEKLLKQIEGEGCDLPKWAGVGR